MTSTKVQILINLVETELSRIIEMDLETYRGEDLACTGHGIDLDCRRGLVHHVYSQLHGFKRLQRKGTR